ncbi:MAG: hypothetical protein RSA10_02445 [Bacilli bacterium]
MKDVKIPIKSIISSKVEKYKCIYEETEFNLLRRYFISCLNLGYLTPNSLELIVDKFCYKIKKIVKTPKVINLLNYYKIENDILIINDDVKGYDEALYELTFFTAVTETLFESSSEYLAIITSVIEIAAEKIHNFDVTNSKIMDQKVVTETVNTSHTFKTEFINYPLIIHLLRQFFLYKQTSEEIIVRECFFNQSNKVINNLINDGSDNLLIKILNQIFELNVRRKTKRIDNFLNEDKLIIKYQLIIKASLDKTSDAYKYFSKMVTNQNINKINE